jgi:cell division protein FtsW (lipid II flippase)
LLGYGGLYGTVFGVLYFIGFLTPYHAANQYQKAKTKVWDSIISAPISVLMLIATFYMFKSRGIKSYIIIMIILSFILLLMNLWRLISGLNTLQKFRKYKSRT